MYTHASKPSTPPPVPPLLTPPSCRRCAVVVVDAHDDDDDTLPVRQLVVPREPDAVHGDAKPRARRHVWAKTHRRVPQVQVSASKPTSKYTQTGVVEHARTDHSGVDV